MDGVKKIFANFSGKKYAFWHDKMLNGTIFAERERERERDNHRYVMYRVFSCAYINKIYSHDIVFTQYRGFFVSSPATCLKTNLFKF